MRALLIIGIILGYVVLTFTLAVFTPAPVIPWVEAVCAILLVLALVLLAGTGYFLPLLIILFFTLLLPLLALILIGLPHHDSLGQNVASLVQSIGAEGGLPILGMILPIAAALLAAAAIFLVREDDQEHEGRGDGTE